MTKWQYSEIAGPCDAWAFWWTAEKAVRWGCPGGPGLQRSRGASSGTMDGFHIEDSPGVDPGRPWRVAWPLRGAVWIDRRLIYWSMQRVCGRSIGAGRGEWGKASTLEPPIFLSVIGWRANAHLSWFVSSDRQQSCTQFHAVIQSPVSCVGYKVMSSSCAEIHVKQPVYCKFRYAWLFSCCFGCCSRPIRSLNITIYMLSRHGFGLSLILSVSSVLCAVFHISLLHKRYTTGA